MRFVDVFWYARIAVRLSGTVKLGCRWQPCSTVYHVKWFPTTKSKGITYKQKETNKSYCFDSFCFLEITNCCNREKCWILNVSARFYFRLQSRQQEELRVSVFWSLKIHVCARKVSCLMFTTFDWRSNSSFSFCASLLFALRSEWKELMEHTLPFSLQPFSFCFSYLWFGNISMLLKAYCYVSYVIVVDVTNRRDCFPYKQPIKFSSIANT